MSDKEEEGRDLTKIDTGLIVIGPDESEFVWVPVNDINRMVMCKSKTASEEDQCNIELNEDKTKLICTKHGNSEDICGKLYVTALFESFNSTLKTQTYSKDSGLREPNLVTTYDNNTEYNDGLFTETSLENEFKEMAVLVAKYGGFYVGRYEMGLTENNKPVSKNASIPENNIITANASNTITSSWYGLYSKAKEYNSNEGVNDKIKSSMIWGSQYDAMMLWMQENGIEVKNGGYGTDTKPTPEVERNTELTTGLEKNDILNNIYDVLGCHYEWTIESYETTVRVSHRRIS